MDTILQNKYRIIRKIGEGGMGSVYEAEHLTLHRKVAIKFLLPEYTRNEETLRRFEREAVIAAQLDSPNVVHIYDFDRSENGYYYIVMEYLEGRELRKILKEEKRLPPQRLINIMLQVAQLLDQAHSKGIIHRDLKPENIFIVNKEGNEIVKILDFGISKIRQSSKGSLTQTGAIIGTPYYMSPEQAKGVKEIDHRVDIYALGVICYEAITGELPINAENVTGILVKIVTEPPPPIRMKRADLPEAVERAIIKAMAKEPNDRYNSCLEFVVDLARGFGIPLEGLKLTPLNQYSTNSLVESSLETDSKESMLRRELSSSQPNIVKVKGLTTKMILLGVFIGIGIILSIILFFVGYKGSKVNATPVDKKMVSINQKIEEKSKIQSSRILEEKGIIKDKSYTRIEFRTEPKEALVYIGDKLLCQTDCSFDFDSSLEKVEFTIKKDGYKPIKKVVELRGIPLIMEIGLEREEDRVLNKGVDSLKKGYVKIQERGSKDGILGIEPIKAEKKSIKKIVDPFEEAQRVIESPFLDLSDKLKKRSTKDIKLLDSPF